LLLGQATKFDEIKDLVNQLNLLPDTPTVLEMRGGLQKKLDAMPQGK